VAVMFVIGDLIYFPVFGAGYVASIEDKKIHGEISKYYVINFVINKMSILIPVFSEEAKKIRRAVSLEEYVDVLQILMSPNLPLSCKWSERQRYYNDSIKAGDIFILSSILRDINGLSKSKKLSKSEAKIYREVLNMVGSEISLVLNKDFDETKKEIQSILKINQGIR
jgi:CarD family transcriptional regulator